MTYYVSSGTLNPTHSLTHLLAVCLYMVLSRTVTVSGNVGSTTNVYAKHLLNAYQTVVEFAIL